MSAMAAFLPWPAAFSSPPGSRALGSSAQVPQPLESSRRSVVQGRRDAAYGTAPGASARASLAAVAAVLGVALGAADGSRRRQLRSGRLNNRHRGCSESALTGATVGGHSSCQIRTDHTVECRAGPALDLEIKQKVDKKTEEESKTAKDFWAVMVHAPIRNCRMPWCKIPGLRNIICTCLKDGITPPAAGGAAIRSKDGKCALTVTEYAEVLTEGVPVLSRSKAYEVSTRLFESAMANDVGTAMVIGAFKKAAEEYEKKLAGLGLWVSIAQIDRD
ncbi:unnamed protein product [Polarella glacialis]|uniref:Uncharacterized protein n=1 Tax=Polarella glacialis TaxID=89957 RepID=A0A813HSN0_POLGL|nr:unnamed protein product [Polarella glacialis]|mmetsp:Transcript_24927/g.44343  ORF Transcript_24927/g.44343 Transcript_24927/m.44343 type:complete len:275 (-) Transcript_24927:25-849(-)